MPAFWANVSKHLSGRSFDLRAPLLPPRGLAPFADVLPLDFADLIDGAEDDDADDDGTVVGVVGRLLPPAPVAD